MRAAALLLIASAATAPAWAEDTMPWQPSLEVAQRNAAQTNRFVILHFWGPQCPPCVQVEREVFSQGETGRALAQNFVAVKLNVDDYRSTARLYGVTRIPTDVVLTPSGQVVSKTISPVEPQKYVAMLNQIADDRRQASSVRTAAATGPVENAGYRRGTDPPAYAGGVEAPSVEVQVPDGQPQRSSRWGGQNAEGGTAASPDPRTIRPTDIPVRDSFASTRPTGAAYDRSPATAGSNVPSGAGYSAASGGEFRGQAAVAPPQSPAGVNPSFAVAPSFGAGATVESSASVNSRTAPPGTGVSPTQTPAGIQLPQGSPPLVLDGNCPVTLSSGKRWQRGDVRYGAVHRGRTYLFAGPAEQQQFLASPDSYMPMLSGDDPVMAIDHGQQVPGQRKFGAFYHKRVYLFASEETMARFTQSPDRYVAVVLQAMNAR